MCLGTAPQTRGGGRVLARGALASEYRQRRNCGRQSENNANIWNMSQTIPRCKFLESRHGCNSFFLFDSTQSQKVLLRLNSCLTMALQELIQINSSTLQELIQITSRLKMIFFIKFDSNRLTTQYFPEYFYSNQLTTLKNFREFLFKSTHDPKNLLNIDSNQVMT